MGMDVHQMLELPEYLYIQELMDIVQQLPDAVQKPIRARDTKAFMSFLGDPAKGFFQKYDPPLAVMIYCNHWPGTSFCFA